MDSTQSASFSDSTKPLDQQWDPESRTALLQTENLALQQRVAELDGRVSEQAAKFQACREYMRKHVFPFEKVNHRFSDLQCAAVPMADTAKLPPELLNQVYHELFIFDKPVRITYSTALDDGWGFVKDGLQGTHLVEHSGRAPKWKPFLRRDETALLQVSAMINQEASPILTFAKLIRHIMLARPSGTNGPISPSNFKHCKGIQSLDWVVHVNGAQISPSELQTVVGLILPSLKRFCMLERDPTKRRAQFEKLRLVSGRDLPAGMYARVFWHNRVKIPDEEYGEHDNKGWPGVNMVKKGYAIPVCAIPMVDIVEGETEFSKSQINLWKVAVAVEKRLVADKVIEALDVATKRKWLEEI
ncbi:hypothetical protein EJ03DRAFT_385538 [Teratosphaeria nubilosa]|uniref:Uncharacterized protein n=1 Tax=Teratosphaeria nubilosa TaxID=161662 RepID=A0A6G1KWR4_9PEZI|nr:hypothetical protein EJ03DRAFT_385538 [Teratosphaeria nubilosa]